MSRTAIIILGMHRSGTSCLTGSLEQAGLYLGNVNRKAPYNLKGNNENRAIMDLNDSVLSENGASWDNPPDTVARWPGELKQLRDQLLSAYPEGQIIGFKDPRTLFTLEGWLEALPGARLVGTFRHPLAVARSLEARNNFTLERSLGLWYAYNSRLLKLKENNDFPLICFDWPADKYSAALHSICNRLNLEPPASGFDFFQTALRTQSLPVDSTQDQRIQSTYDMLTAMSEHLIQD